MLIADSATGAARRLEFISPMQPPALCSTASVYAAVVVGGASGFGGLLLAQESAGGRLFRPDFAQMRWRLSLSSRAADLSFGSADG